MNPAARLPGTVRDITVSTLAVLLVVQILALFELLPGSVNDGGGTWTYFLLLLAAVLLALSRTILVKDDRTAWALFTFGLASWTAGDLYYWEVLVDDPPIPYPSLSDALYGVLYIAFIGGLKSMSGRIEGSGLVWLGLAVCFLGLATLWSLLVYGVVIDSAVGSTAAIATTVAFPALDLFLLGATLLAVAARNWRPSRGFGALILAFSVLAVVDLVYAAQVAGGTYADGALIELGWLIGALAVGVAAWMPSGPRGGEVHSNRLLPIGTLAGAGIALVVLTLDHFDRVDLVTFVLSAATLALAVVYPFVLFRAAIRARAEAVASENLRSESTEASIDCIFTVDGKGIIREWNRAAEKTFGYSREQAIGHDFADLIAPEEMREQHRAGVASLVGADSPLLNRRLQTNGMDSSGRVFPVEMTVRRLHHDPEMFTAFLRDVTESRRREEENSRMAAIVRSSQDAIIAIDLDGVVTSWNQGAENLYGFTAAEATGRRLTDLTVPADRREEIEAGIRRVIAQGSLASETRRRSKNGEILDVSIRAFPIRDLNSRPVGISISAHDVTEQRRREAREARNLERKVWNERIERSLRDECFEFWRQPVVDAVTRGVDHHELLIRMRLDGQVLSPGVFLPHAESSGSITRIDEWAIHRGIAFSLSFPVAINLSGRSLSHPALPQMVADRIDELGADPGRVRFEITETAAAENLEAAKRLVQSLGDIGCGVALDDFGAGYGSFTYLKHLPVRELKIDMSFVRGLLEDEQSRKVVSSMVAVARNFDIVTVAEGVEDDATRRVLVGLGVDLIQGFGIGRPEPLE